MNEGSIYFKLASSSSMVAVALELGYQRYVVSDLLLSTYFILVHEVVVLLLLVVACCHLFKGLLREIRRNSNLCPRRFT